MERQLAFLVELKKPTAYALLERLRKSGYLGVNNEREGNRPERRVYTLTSAGDARFLELVQDNLGRYAPPRFTDAIGVYFLDALPPEKANSLLRQRLATIDERLEEFRPKVAEHQGLAVQPVLEHYVAHLDTDRTFLAGLLHRREENR
jgi:DNA-binding PadR family transcriptional regulator